MWIEDRTNVDLGRRFESGTGNEDRDRKVGGVNQELRNGEMEVINAKT
jgi:hypothetical protein